MVVLSDTSLHQLCAAGMLKNYDPALVGPASVDLRLGKNLLVEYPQQRELIHTSIVGTTPEDPYWLQPMEFVLAETIEVFHIPDEYCAQFVLRSSCARAGLQHLHAGFVDPGFNNSVLTLELKNVRRMHAVALWYGMAVGQLVVMQMDSPPLSSYSKVGRYNGSATVTPSKGVR